MRYLVWLSRAILFLVLFGFAVKNDQPVVVRYFFGYEWLVSLVVILLIFFAIGVGTGALALLGNILAQRREIATLKKELRLKNTLAEAADNKLH